MEYSEKGKLELISMKEFTANEEMYKIIDFLNKSLKEKSLMFGLTYNPENQKMSISIYEI